MLRREIAVITLAFGLTTHSFGQLKGDKYFEKSEYHRAIQHYKKDSKSKSFDKRQKALIKLGDSYRSINEYVPAENAYREAVNMTTDLEPAVYYNYAQVLKVNMKYEEAAEQYQNYIRLAPNDEYAKNALKFCREIKYYLSKPIEYSVKNMQTINTASAEFCPYVINNKLMFVAERVSFDFVNYSVNDHDGQPYLNMYISNIAGLEPSKSKSFSKRLNSEFHDGPACVSADGHTLYFTRVINTGRKGKTAHANIYTATGSDRNWKNIKGINLNTDNYSIAHPSISSDDQTLFFVSDMPGGFGGKDIYMSKREGDQWGAAVNLGPDINTSGDEMFPCIRKDGTLYFSSNGLPGFGGLDIYSAKILADKWILQRNEGLNLNSSTDDFSITFLNDSVGYFSSNRPGGRGRDDIYMYEFTNKSVVVDGTVLLTEDAKDVAAGRKVILLDEQGNKIDSTTTDEKGFFAFKNLEADKKYMATIEELDPTMRGKARYYLAENDSVIHRVSGKHGDKKFTFRNLPIDPNSLPDLYTEDDLVFAGTLMSGDNANTPLKNAKLKLVNEYGDVMEEATTNEFGAFAFRNIPSDQNYLISIEESDVALPEGTKITLANKAGKEVKTFFKAKDSFTFRILTTDKTLLEDMAAEDVNLVMGIYGFMYDQDKRPIMNAKIRIKDENGENLQEFVTSEKGKFNFKNLSAEMNYLFETEENDPNLAGVKRIFIADNKGRIYKVIDLIGGKFSFKILEIDKTALGKFTVEDPKLTLKKKALAKKTPPKKEKKEVAKADPLEKEPAVTETKEEPVAAAQPTTEPVKAPLADTEEESELTVVIVESIYYPYGEYRITGDGQQVLDKAVDALTEYPKLIMEISSHTDAQSSAGFNMGLSQRRAQAAVDYLVNKGINRSRLKARGFGETKLLNHCADGVSCTDEEHRVNRRTEFKITKPVKK
jgi:outer membrane protein OmpA-like peptidoglycan-associated protein